MRKKVVKTCIGVSALGLLTAVTFLNFGAYACLKKVGLR